MKLIISAVFILITFTSVSAHDNYRENKYYRDYDYYSHSRRDNGGHYDVDNDRTTTNFYRSNYHERNRDHDSSDKDNKYRENYHESKDREHKK